MMELADVLDSKSSGSDTVRVRPPLPAPKKRQVSRELVVFRYICLCPLEYTGKVGIFGGWSTHNDVDALPNKTVTVVPTSSSLSIFNSASYMAQMCLTMASPSPVPPVFLERDLSTR